jgi:hypothetical protein
MQTKKTKTINELEILVLEAARYFHGCAGIKSVAIAPNEHLGWIVTGWERGEVSIADSTRAVAVAQIDLQQKYDLLKDK